MSDSISANFSFSKKSELIFKIIKSLNGLLPKNLTKSSPISSENSFAASSLET